MSWVGSGTCRHWGEHGAAGLLVHHSGHVLLHQRARSTHHGGTTSLPGGARIEGESARAAALRQTVEETGLSPADLRLGVEHVDTCGCGWSYTTIIASADHLLTVKKGREGAASWVQIADVSRLRLHRGFAAAWPVLRSGIPTRKAVPFEGWRIFSLDDECRLRGPIMHHLTGYDLPPWRPGLNVATCTTAHPEPPPAAACNCGFRVLPSAAALAKTLRVMVAPREAARLGTVGMHIGPGNRPMRDLADVVARVEASGLVRGYVPGDPFEHNGIRRVSHARVRWIYLNPAAHHAYGALRCDYIGVAVHRPTPVEWQALTTKGSVP